MTPTINLFNGLFLSEQEYGSCQVVVEENTRLMMLNQLSVCCLSICLLSVCKSQTERNRGYSTEVNNDRTSIVWTYCIINTITYSCQFWHEYGHIHARIGNNMLK